MIHLRADGDSLKGTCAAKSSNFDFDSVNRIMNINK